MRTPGESKLFKELDELRRQTGGNMKSGCDSILNQKWNNSEYPPDSVDRIRRCPSLGQSRANAETKVAGLAAPEVCCKELHTFYKALEPEGQSPGNDVGTWWETNGVRSDN